MQSSVVHEVSHSPAFFFSLHFVADHISAHVVMVVVIVVVVVVVFVVVIWVVAGFSQQSADEGNMDPMQLSFPHVRSPAHS